MWDDYHREAMENAQEMEEDEDWDEEDDEGVEIIYQH